MKLSFYGADQCVTGSCHCLEVGGKHILIDCGLQQGRDEIDNASLPFHPGQIDYVLVTHAHIDHSGRIPLLIKQGFQDWVWRDPARREKLVRLYNDKFNSIRPREYAHHSPDGGPAGYHASGLRPHSGERR